MKTNMNTIKNMYSKALAKHRFLGPRNCLTISGFRKFDKFPRSQKAWLSGKKGISEIEVVVSFVLFIAIVLSTFVYINPLNLPPARSMLDTLENSVRQNASVSLEVIPFSFDSGGSCFSINKDLSNSFVTDSKGNEVPSSPAGSIGYSSGNFYYINKGIGRTKMQSPECAVTPGYLLSANRTENFYYNKSLAALERFYNLNYSQLKQDFKIPGNNDFSVIILDSDYREIISMRMQTPRTNVLSTEFPIQIISDENGIKIINGYMRLLIW